MNDLGMIGHYCSNGFNPICYLLICKDMYDGVEFVVLTQNLFSKEGKAKMKWGDHDRHKRGWRS